MTFRQERLIFEDRTIIDHENKTVITIDGPSSSTKAVYGDAGYSFLLEDEYLTAIAAEGWVLHTANYCVLGKQEAHYFLFAKE